MKKKILILMISALGVLSCNENEEEIKVEEPKAKVENTTTDVFWDYGWLVIYPEEEKNYYSLDKRIRFSTAMKDEHDNLSWNTRCCHKYINTNPWDTVYVKFDMLKETGYRDVVTWVNGGYGKHLGGDSLSIRLYIGDTISLNDERIKLYK